MVNITGDFSIGTFLCRNLLGHEPCHDFNPTGTGKRMARLNMRFNNLVNKFTGLSVGGGPPYNDNPQNETGIDYTLKDFLYFNDYDMNNFSFLEFLDNKEQSKLKELNEKFLQVFKSNIDGVLQHIDQSLTDIENKEAVQDMIACVQKIIKLNYFFKILIISQQEIDLSQEDYDMLGGAKREREEGPIMYVNDENVNPNSENLLMQPVKQRRKLTAARRSLQPFFEPKPSFNQPFFEPKPEFNQPVQGQGSAPVLQGPITAVASPVPSPQPSSRDLK
jgi:hypothetical protein